MNQQIVQFLPFVLIIAVFYFLLIRPRQQQMKKHQEMIAALRRGDQVVTSGGIIAKVVRVFEGDELQVELAENVRVRLLKNTIIEVRSHTEPVTKEISAPKEDKDKDDDKKDD